MVGNRVDGANLVDDLGQGSCPWVGYRMTVLHHRSTSVYELGSMTHELLRANLELTSFFHEFSRPLSHDDLIRPVFRLSA